MTRALQAIPRRQIKRHGRKTMHISSRQVYDLVLLSSNLTWFLSLVLALYLLSVLCRGTGGGGSSSICDPHPPHNTLALSDSLQDQRFARHIRFCSWHRLFTNAELFNFSGGRGFCNGSSSLLPSLMFSLLVLWLTGCKWFVRLSFLSPCLRTAWLQLAILVALATHTTC